MKDIGLYIKEGRVDLELDGDDLKADDGLETSALISLFSDKRVLLEELPQGQSSKRGWWGDTFPETEGDKIGSKLWLLDREKRTPETRNRAEDLAKEAFSWLIEDGIAQSVGLSAAFTEEGQLKLNADITKHSGLSHRFNFIWNAQEMRRA